MAAWQLHRLVDARAVRGSADAVAEALAARQAALRPRRVADRGNGHAIALDRSWRQLCRRARAAARSRDSESCGPAYGFLQRSFGDGEGAGVGVDSAGLASGPRCLERQSCRGLVLLSLGRGRDPRRHGVSFQVAEGSLTSSMGTSTMAGKTHQNSAKVAKKPAVKRIAAKPRLLSGGNPQIHRADGDAPVQAYIAAMPGWKRDVGGRLDALIERTVPDLRKAVKWNSPFYGVAGEGWFLSFHCFTKYVKVAFFRGASLRPVPPGGSKGKHTRYLDIHEHDKLVSSWIRQASELPGWVP